MKRLKIALCIALAGTAIMVVGILLGMFVLDGTEKGFTIAMNVMSVGWLVSIVAYFFGGLGTAVKLAGKIAKWGWFVTPFPIDIITFIFAFMIAVYMLIFTPIIPIAIAYKENR